MKKLSFALVMFVILEVITSESPEEAEGVKYANTCEGRRFSFLLIVAYL